MAKQKKQTMSKSTNKPAPKPVAGKVWYQQTIPLFAISGVLLLSATWLVHSQIKNPAIKPRSTDLKFPAFIQNIGQNSENIAFTGSIDKGAFTIDTKGKINYRFHKNINISEEILTDSSFTGAVSGKNPSTTQVNIFQGKDPQKWKQNIPNFNSINYGEVLKGIHLEVKNNQQNIEKIFTLNPGSSPESIKIKLNGAQKIEQKTTGELELKTTEGLLAMSKPIAYQEINAEKISVPVKYKLYDQTTYGFETGEYDQNYPIIIDPILAATFLGGSADENTQDKLGIGIDSSGKIFVSGQTASSDIPIPSGGAYDTFAGGNNAAYLARYNNDLTTLEAFTYFNGSGDDNAVALAIDDDDNVYIAGQTYSNDIPMTAGAYQNSILSIDGFIAKFNNDASQLLASTYFGGSFEDNIKDIAVADNIVYITGYNSAGAAPNFPITPGSFQETSVDNNYFQDAFVSALEFDPGTNNITLRGSTFLGGDDSDEGNSLVVDPVTHLIYITGTTFSTDGVDFPTTAGSFQENSVETSNNSDAFATVMEFDPNNDTITMRASTFLGGGIHDEGLKLVRDNTNNLYITGGTNSLVSSPAFPTTSGAYQQNSLETFTNNGDAFVTKLAYDSNTDVISMNASTFIGGSNIDKGHGITLDNSGNVFTTGRTASDNYPVSLNSLDPDNIDGTNDGFVSKLSSDLTQLVASSYLGGTSNDFGLNITTTTIGNPIVTGRTASNTFPVTSGTYQDNIGAGSNFNGFIAILNSSLNDSNCPTLNDNTPGSGSDLLSGECFEANINAGPLSFLTIPTNTSFPNSEAGLKQFNNGSGTNSGDLLTVSDLRNVTDSFEVQLSASAFQDGSGTNNIGLEQLYVITSLPHTSGNTVDEVNGVEYAPGCVGPQNLTSSVNAEPVNATHSAVGGVANFNTFTTHGSNLGTGTSSTPVVLIESPTAARRCNFYQYISYGLDIPVATTPATYTVTLTYTLI